MTPPLALCVPCTIHKMHDGDTATHATITLDIQIRYLDCWTPELSEKGGPEALSAAKVAEGKKGRLFIPLDKANNVSDLFTFGRVLGAFYPDNQEESEGERLVRLGYATKKKLKLSPPKTYAPGSSGEIGPIEVSKTTVYPITSGFIEPVSIGPQRATPRSLAAINAEIGQLINEYLSTVQKPLSPEDLQTKRDDWGGFGTRQDLDIDGEIKQ